MAPLPSPTMQGKSNIPIVLPSSGNTFSSTLSPGAYPSLVGWYRYGAGITIATGVSQWNDQSGNGYNLVQATGALQPVLQSDNTILFNGTTQYLQASFTLNQPSTVYILFKQVAWTSANVVSDGLTTGTMQIIQNSGSPQLAISAGSIVDSNAGLAVGAYDVMCAVYNGAASTSKIGNGAPLIGNAGAGNGGGFTLGANGGATVFGNIQVKEVAIFSVAHSDSIQQQLANWFHSI